MAQYSYAELEALWINAGGSKILAPLMAAIALAESSGNSDALNLTDNNGAQTSVGLWQVSTGTHNYPADWRTPEGNAREAVAKLQSQGLGAWGTYTSGAYKRFLQGSVPPAVIQGGTSGGGGFSVGGIVGDLGKVAGLPITWAKDILGAGGGIAQSILILAAPLRTLAEILDWFLHPAHWIRLFAGLAGGVLVLFGVWQLSHAGGA